MWTGLWALDERFERFARVSGREQHRQSQKNGSNLPSKLVHDHCQPRLIVSQSSYAEDRGESASKHVVVK